MRLRLWLLTGACCLVMVGTAAAQSASAPLASELVTLLEQKKLDSIAARMVGDGNRFVAALYFPGSQLLVVSASYTAPSLLQEHIYGGRYRDVYTALHSGGTLDGKFFVLDMAANGFPPSGKDSQNDVVYLNEQQQVLMNGDWKGQKLSKDEYAKRIAAADPRYAEMLKVLIAQAKTAN